MNDERGHAADEHGNGAGLESERLNRRGAEAQSQETETSEKD
jgi:hypothetical protein